MLINSPRNIAISNAVFIAAISGISLTLVSVYFANIEPIIIMGFVIVIFVFAFILINYSINRFFQEKIKVIYKTIGKLQKTSRQRKKEEKTSDVLDIVNQVVLDWSEEKKKEIDTLREMAVYRREFLGNVSHELKTPIFNIQGYVNTLLTGGINDDDINVKFLKKTDKSVNRMIALVDDLEEISKLESANLILHHEVFNLYDLTVEVIDFLEQKAIENNTAITINSGLSKSIRVKADKKRIRQVLINLIDNAIKYGNSTDNKVRISYYSFDDNYLVEVQDNGIGIPEEHLVRIFERFYRIDESRSREKGGTGLGLAIVKHIIEAHRQTISVRSIKGEGTTFSFTIKMA